ncbi:MAG: substrate-binding domain-containing protein, partial [Oscillospiraceae bacterium]|nr:substrate-binding domain-containing protein [Oscillospiraceae bacterium]
MKKTLAILLTLAMCVALLAACADPAPATPPPADTQAPATEAPATGDDLYIAVISKGFQHQFWQAVYEGSRRAAAEYGVRITFEGPESEADIHVQVEMMNTRLAQNPDGIALAALATDSLLVQLADAQTRGIPVVGFDSGVPDAPPGQVLANASTDNQGAAAIGADHMFPEIQAQIAAATTANPVVIAVLSQDAV